MSLARLRLILWLLVAGAAVGASLLYLYAANRPARVEARVEALGQGDYRLKTTAGTEFTPAGLAGHPSMLFFGFTHCPEICPTTLAEMAAWYAALGDEAKDLRAYFITVDPERDTLKTLGEYVGWTDGKIIGVTGTPEDIAKATDAWAVYAEKVPAGDGDYSMDHTASVFLLNRQGAFEGTIAYNEDSQTALDKLRDLIAE